MPCWCQGSEVRVNRLVGDHGKATMPFITSGCNPITQSGYSVHFIKDPEIKKLPMQTIQQNIKF